MITVTHTRHRHDAKECFQCMITVIERTVIDEQEVEEIKY
jgi:hypothetical protein